MKKMKKMLSLTGLLLFLLFSCKEEFDFSQLGVIGPDRNNYDPTLPAGAYLETPGNIFLLGMTVEGWYNLPASKSPDPIGFDPPSYCPNVTKIHLFKNGVFQRILEEATVYLKTPPGVLAFSWDIPSNTQIGEGYEIQFFSHKDECRAPLPMGQRTEFFEITNITCSILITTEHNAFYYSGDILNFDVGYVSTGTENQIKVKLYRGTTLLDQKTKTTTTALPNNFDTFEGFISLSGYPAGNNYKIVYEIDCQNGTPSTFTHFFELYP